MADNSDHLHRKDEATLRLPNATRAQWAAAEQYANRHASDLAAMLGFGGRDDTRTKAGAR